MEQRQFEQAITHMVHTEGVERLVPGDVARRLGIERKEAERLLDRMVTEGRLELDSDDDGNLFYFVPGVGAGGVFTVGSGLGPAPSATEDDTEQGSWAGHQAPPGQQPPGQQPPGQQPQRGPWGQPYGSPTPPPANTPPPGAPPWGQAPSQQGWSQGQPPPQGWHGPPPPGYGQQQHGWHGQPPQAPQYGQPGGHGWGPQQGQPPAASWGHQPYNPYATPQQSPYGPPAPHGMQQPYGPQAGYYGHNALVPMSQEPKSPGTAAILSLFFPGAGQLYNGQIGKGLTFFFLTMMLFMPIYSIPLALVPYVWSVVDAYQTSRRINAYGLLPP